MVSEKPTLYLAADKGYDDAGTRRDLAEAGVRAYIPCRRDLGRLEKTAWGAK